MSRPSSSLLCWCGVGARWTTRPAPASGSGEGDAALTGRSRKEGGMCPVACQHPSLLWPLVASCGLVLEKGDGGACFALLLLHWLLAALAAKQPHHFSQACSLHLHLPLPPLPRPFRTRPPSFLHSLPLSFFPSLIQHPSFNTTLSTLTNVDDLIPSFNTPLGDVHSAT